LIINVSSTDIQNFKGGFLTKKNKNLYITITKNENFKNNFYIGNLRTGGNIKDIKISNDYELGYNSLFQINENDEFVYVLGLKLVENKKYGIYEYGLYRLNINTGEFILFINYLNFVKNIEILPNRVYYNNDKFYYLYNG